MTCQGCRYLSERQEGTCFVSRCRRYAPRQTTGTGTGWAEWEWPKTDGHGCGEWRGYELEPPEKPE